MLDLGAFNHPQALGGLKEGVRIGRLCYNLRSPLVQSYSAGYEQARRDIEIEEEKSARIKSEQLEELRRKERRTPSGSGSGKRAGESPVMAQYPLGLDLTLWLRDRNSSNTAEHSHRAPHSRSGNENSGSWLPILITILPGHYIPQTLELGGQVSCLQYQLGTISMIAEQSS